MLFSLLFNFTIAKNITTQSTKRLSKKALLVFGIGVNLALLSYYKYADFFLSNLNTLFGMQIELLHLALPLAISFYTFQQIAYLVDSYRGGTKEYDFLNYTLFVTFFPQLIAGPIVHHKEMMPQFYTKWNMAINYKNIVLGLFIFSIGLFKKVIIADSFGIWASNGFDIAQKLYFIEAWITSFSYTFQLYFDFSGYTDMAIGAALLFNIKIPVNFNSPYKATSIRDFWRRWHITLSNFLKEYIYIPLGGNRHSRLRTYTNLLITFYLAGLWHGAGWMFIIWGVIHGFALIIHRIWERFNIKLPTLLAWPITFLFINFSWVFFRAHNLDDAFKVLKGMLGVNGILLPRILYTPLESLGLQGIKTGGFLVAIEGSLMTLFFIFAAFILVLFFQNSNELQKKFRPNFLYGAFTLFVTLTAFLKLGGPSEFLYFRF
jgi:D-alanyl-lipoteichoic acid acyltransferase DltB (MBOAT superfamily)